MCLSYSSVFLLVAVTLYNFCILKLIKHFLIFNNIKRSSWTTLVVGKQDMVTFCSGPNLFDEYSRRQLYICKTILENIFKL